MFARFLVIALMASVGGGLWSSETESALWKEKGFQVGEKNGVITSLRGSCKDFTSDDFKKLATVTSLTSLQIDGNTINDQALEILGSLTNVEQLSFNSSDCSDDGYRHFQKFINLKKLALWHPSRSRKDFTGRGLAYLKELPKLEALTFAGANAGDEALAAISEITQLQQYQAWHNTETADGLKHLIKLPNLKSLKLGQRLGKTDPSLCNASLASIAQIKSLEKLILMEARLSFDALTQLSALPNLKYLEVSQVDTPDADIEKLKQQLSSVKVEWKPLTEADKETLAKKLRL